MSKKAKGDTDPPKPKFTFETAPDCEECSLDDVACIDDGAAKLEENIAAGNVGDELDDETVVIDD